MLLQILMDERHDTNGEIAGDATTDLEEAYRGFFADGLVPVNHFLHVFETRLDYLAAGELFANNVRDEDIS